ncbi:hypothetical protein BDN70DRAFT_884752 [Pholiota conissans]|uniref:Uncharacterized protein n=1 Tax=Pholiota conissans TaxID=109636 RepID=A0A9P5YV74_9AGAR|nr:hypothetical protein BDN70DRAFT_884752 [Pholiota conissans]
MSALNAADYRAISSPSPSEVSSLTSISSMPTPTTPNTTPNSSPSPSTSDTTGLVSFLAEVDEWLLRINERVAELETRHRKHLSMDNGWLAGMKIDLSAPGRRGDKILKTKASDDYVIYRGAQRMNKIESPAQK